MAPSKLCCKCSGTTFEDLFETSQKVRKIFNTPQKSICFPLSEIEIVSLRHWLPLFLDRSPVLGGSRGNNNQFSVWCTSALTTGITASPSASGISSIMSPGSVRTGVEGGTGGVGLWYTQSLMVDRNVRVHLKGVISSTITEFR